MSVNLVCPKCKTHVFGTTTDKELRLANGAAIVKDKTALVCPNCNNRKVWRPMRGVTGKQFRK